MESPSEWTRLTSSLAISDLNDPAGAWRFLAAQGLVRDNDFNFNTFVGIIDQEAHLGLRPGPSLALRIAQHMVAAGLAKGMGAPDPYALIARPRRWWWRTFGR